MDWNTTLNLVKIALTIPVVYALTYPFLNPTVDGGVFKEVMVLGLGGTIITAIVFLTLVFLYCRDLQLSLSLISQEARQAPPRKDVAVLTAATRTISALRHFDKLSATQAQ